MVTLAMYKARGGILNHLIRFRTQSPYSHCELLVDGFCLSSSNRDGGVRLKLMELPPDHWDLFSLPWASERAVWDHFEQTMGMRYDWLGVCVGQLLSMPIGSKNKWYCSEWCAAALGLRDPWRFSPALLLAAVSRNPVSEGKLAG